MTDQVDPNRLCCALIILVLLPVIILALLGIFSRQSTDEFYHRTSNEESNKQAELLAELQSLSQLVNKTVEENAQEILDVQEALKEAFSNASVNSTPSQEEWCEGACRNATNLRILLIFPIRDRWNLLKTLLNKLLRLLQTPNTYIFNVIIEQTSSMPFNKGLLMNAAVIEMAKRVPFDCIIFHDVDLVPVSGDEVYYECPSYPRHLSVKVDKFGYSLPYLNLIGGVLAMPLQHFLQTNGFSNMFWGWGAEDDEMFERLSILGIPVTRPMPNPTRYTMLLHKRSSSLDTWRASVLLKMSLKRYRLDGLNSARYKVQKLERKSACELIEALPQDCQVGMSHVTHILVDPQPLKGKDLESVKSTT
ncbi:hypothetical protein Aperf_G00000001216 [Anoplocephala perfoliata]